jgi:hypothetical protein
MNATEDLQIKIQKGSAEAQAKVVATLFDNRTDVYKAKNGRDAEFARLFREGVIDRKQYEQSVRDNERIAEEQIQRLNETEQMLTVRHLEFLKRTLELFRAEAMDRGII